MEKSSGKYSPKKLGYNIDTHDLKLYISIPYFSSCNIITNLLFINKNGYDSIIGKYPM